MDLNRITPVFGLADNKGTVQPELLPSLVSASVIGLFESNISRLATSEISTL